MDRQPACRRRRSCDHPFLLGCHLSTARSAAQRPAGGLSTLGLWHPPSRLAGKPPGSPVKPIAARPASDDTVGGGEDAEAHAVQHLHRRVVAQASVRVAGWSVHLPASYRAFAFHVAAYLVLSFRCHPLPQPSPFPYSPPPILSSHSSRPLRLKRTSRSLRLQLAPVSAPSPWLCCAPPLFHSARPSSLGAHGTSYLGIWIG